MFTQKKSEVLMEKSIERSWYGAWRGVLTMRRGERETIRRSEVWESDIEDDDSEESLSGEEDLDEGE